MDNKITIDIDAILKAEDDSIDCAETIRQIGLVCLNPYMDSRTVSALIGKVRKGFEVCGLYPEVIKVIKFKSS